jgi:hypothetical protein
MLNPDLFFHLFASQNCLRAQLVEVNINYLSYTSTELLNGKILQFFLIFGHHFVGNVTILIVTQIFEILFIDVPFAELSDGSNVFME